MGRKKQQKVKLTEKIKRVIEERLVISPDSIMKTAAFGSGAYLIYTGTKAVMSQQGYWILENFVKGDILRPAWVLAKESAGKSQTEILHEAPIDIPLLCMSLLASYVIVEHGPGLLQMGISSILGLMA